MKPKKVKKRQLKIPKQRKKPYG